LRVLSWKQVLMKKKAKVKTQAGANFSEFISDPPVALALLVFALIALFLAILEFSRVISF